MVADEVEVASRRAGTDDVWLWTSDGSGSFTIAPAAPGRLDGAGRGTHVTLKLKSDARTFLEAHEIERIVRTYSDHILFPVELLAKEGDKPAEPRQINAGSAIWQRPKSELEANDYAEAYRTISGQFDEPALNIHYRAEGRQSYAVLLFVPKSRPFDIFDPARKGRVKLYVRRVYITDEAELLPSYLRFVNGVVDSEDVPLNISREMLQNNPAVAQIRKALTSRVVAELETHAAKDAAGYAQVWETFGTVLKEGLYEDFERRDPLMKLARFRSTAGDGWRSLADYVASLKPNQTEIYYLAGEGLDRLKASPQLEAARARDVEVLLLADPVDSFWTTAVQGFEGKPLKSLSKGDVDLSLIPPVAAEKAATASPVETGPLIAALKRSLGDLVSDVRISKRLVDSPSCLVAEGRGPDRMLERLLARQERGVGGKPILEINAGHALVKAAAAAAQPATAGDTVDDAVGDWAHMLLGQAYILDGEVPPDPARFAAGINRLALAPGGG